METFIAFRQIEIFLDQNLLMARLGSSGDSPVNFEGALPLIPGRGIGKLKFAQLVPDPENEGGILNFVAEGEVQNPDWKLETILFGSVQGQVTRDVFRLTDSDWFTLHGIRLGEESLVAVDDRPVHLIPTINHILALKISEIFPALQKIMLAKVCELSIQYFEDDYLIRVLEKLYWKWNHELSPGHLRWTIHASTDKSELDKAANDFPSVQLELPTEKLRRLILRLPLPPIQIMDYQLRPTGIEIPEQNGVLVTLEDRAKNLELNLKVQLELQDNTIFPKVDDIEITGLGMLKSVLFKALKSTVIRQIEKRPVEIASLYRSDLEKIKSNFPFITIQNGSVPVVEQLSVLPDSLSFRAVFPHESAIESNS